ncbi:MAG: transglycosylase SLT domain-containing protein [Acidobacteriota bacterium]
MMPLAHLRQLPRFDAYDSLFKAAASRYFGAHPYPWQRLKAQAIQESMLDPNARNARTGAVGLMQLLPGTDRWIDDDLDATDPEGNIENGAALMAYLCGIGTQVPLRNGGSRAFGWYRGFLDCPWPERMRFALAGYNAGWGHVGGPKRPNARSLAYLEGKDSSRWAVVAPYLRQVTGANAAETLHYVEAIEQYTRILLEAHL